MSMSGSDDDLAPHVLKSFGTINPEEFRLRFFKRPFTYEIALNLTGNFSKFTKLKKLFLEFFKLIDFQIFKKL